MKRTFTALGLAAALVLSITACSTAGGTSFSKVPEEQALVLSDEKVTLNGKTIAQSSGGAVAVGHDIVSYQANMGTDYGTGTQSDEHTQQEIEAHTVVTIREAGTYRVSGSLPAGQLAVDLGQDAKTNPGAVVTLILDGVDISCTVAPAVIFYRVYECDTEWVDYDDQETDNYISTPTMDTTQAGANVILADGSINNINGSYVALIYQEGTTDKLHKYDGAFYSKMSMNIGCEDKGTGVLNITGKNEGLDSELHLTINGGIINIQAENDGINTNQDGVSVTTINDGTLRINAGLGAEGDGIDSNGYLVINGGSVYTMANESSPDGGIDADGDILLNGGYIIATGTRNDWVSPDSAQQYIELSFASTLPAGSSIELTDPDGKEPIFFTTEKACQSITFSSPDLTKNVAYTLKVNGVVQQYTGNFSGDFGRMGGGPGQYPGGGQPPAASKGQQAPSAGTDGQMDGIRPEGGSFGDIHHSTGEATSEFNLTDEIHSFSGISDSVQFSGKTQVTFSADVSMGDEGKISVTNILPSAEVEGGHVQISITDVPSKNYAASCLLSDGDAALASILPTQLGAYLLTISVTGDETYTGTSQFHFVLPES